RLFVNKAWGYGDPRPDHYFLALNGRLTELQGAVAVAQLSKLEDNVDRRIDAATLLTKLLAGVPSITTPVVADGDVHTFWRYLVRVDGAGLAGDGLRGGVMTLAADLADQGVASAPRYIQKPAFECEVIAEQRTSGKRRCPVT